MALDALIGKVSLLAKQMPSSLELSTSCTASRFSVRLDRWSQVDGELLSTACTVPEQVLNEVVNLNGDCPEYALKSLHERLFALVDVEQAG